MYINSSTDKIIRDKILGISKDNQADKELIETSYDAPDSTLPNIFSIAASASKKIEEKQPETLAEIVALCRAQMNKPLCDRYPPLAYAVKIGRLDAVKFFIEEGESVNAKTPDIPVYRDPKQWKEWKQGIQQGYSPLEIAINNQDVEMVRLLTTYKADPELNYHRYNPLYFDNDKCYIEFEDHYSYKFERPSPSSPLLDALKLGNEEIIDLVIKAYTDPKKLNSVFDNIQNLKNPNIMRFWIEHNFFLWKGVYKEVPRSIIELFLNKKGLQGNFSDIENLLKFGWIVTKKEFEQLLTVSEPQIVNNFVEKGNLGEIAKIFGLSGYTYGYVSKKDIDLAIKSFDPKAFQLIMDYSRHEESPFSVLSKHDVAYRIKEFHEKGHKPEREHLDIAITHGSLNAVSILIEQGVPYEGALQLAVNHRQLPIAKYLAQYSTNFYELIELCRAQINKPLREQYPPIAFAVQLGRHDLVKFFIDHGESVNAATPDIPVWWEIGPKNLVTMKAGMQQGYSPLEIAIKLEDAEMVKILTTYNQNNKAIPEISHKRFAKVWPYGYGTDDYKTYHAEGHYEHFEAPSSLFLDALKIGNQEIIDLIIKAYTDSDKLYAEYTHIKESKNLKTMRSWIEQSVYLWKGIQEEVPDSVVNLFMQNDQVLNGSFEDVDKLLQYGYVVTRNDFEQALKSNDLKMLHLLLDKGRMEESPFALLAKHNRVDLVHYLQNKGNVPQREHFEIAIKQGSLDVVKAFATSDLSFKGALILAAENKQKAIVTFLLGLPIDKAEVEEAHKVAYLVHAYDIMEILEKL